MMGENFSVSFAMRSVMAEIVLVIFGVDVRACGRWTLVLATRELDACAGNEVGGVCWR